MTALLTATMTLLAGCSAPPSQSDGQAVLEQKIQRESNGLIKLVSFHKEDGVAQEMNGVKTYKLKYSAVIQFTDDCLWGDGSPMMGWQGGYKADRPSNMGAGMAIFDASSHYKEGKKGQTENVTSWISWQKTENGWTANQ